MAGTQRSKIRVIVAVVVAALVGLGLTMCGDDGGNPGTGPQSSSTTVTTDGASTSSLQKEAADVTRELLGKGDDAPAIARAEGMVDTLNGPSRMQPAVAEIVAVELEDAAILLRWRIKSTGGSLELRPTTFSTPSTPSTSASEVVLVSPAGKESAQPYRNRQGGFGVVCVCSTVPNEVDQTGQDMTGLYPAFSQPPTEVEVRIPGFPAIGGVRVTSR